MFVPESRSNDRPARAAAAPAAPAALASFAPAEPLTNTAPPLPGRATIQQRWSDIVFLHWRVSPAEVAHHLPPGTRPDIDEHGDTWVGLIPFVLSEHAFLPLPAVPGLGTFIEINVRLYSVDAHGRRGVVFRSLDAEQLPSVLAARALFGLPYQWMRGSLSRDADTLHYRSQRRTGSRPATSIHVRVPARGDATLVDTALSRFLTARWGFHERQLGRTIYARNTHEPWPLVDAELLSLDDELLAAAGFPALAHRAPDSVLAMPLGHPGVITRFASPQGVRGQGVRSGNAQGASAPLT